MQWSLIKIISSQECSPTLTSICVPATPSQTVLIAKRYSASKKDWKLRPISHKYPVRVGEPSWGKIILVILHCASLICKILKYKMKRLPISQKLVFENFTYTNKFYVHEIAAVNLSKVYFLKNAKKTCKPKNQDLNRDWKKCLRYLCWLENKIPLE